MRKTIKRWLCVLLMGTLLLAGCSKSGEIQGDSGGVEATTAPAGENAGETPGPTASTASDGKEKATVIAVSLPSATEGWDMQVGQVAEHTLKSLVSDTLGYELLTSTDVAGQMSQLDTLAGEGVNVVVIYPMDSAVLAESAVKLQNLGTPIVLFNGSIDGLLPAATVTMDQELLGAKAAQKVKSKGSGVENILVFSNDSSNAAAARKSSFESGLGTGISLVQGGNTSGDMQTAQDLMANWLSDKKDEDLEKIGGIFAPDENSLLGIMNGLAAYEKKNGTAFSNLKIIAGCGGSDDLFAFIRELPKYPVSVFYYPPASVNTAISLAQDIAAGKSYEDAVSVEAVEVNHDNAAEYITK